MSGSGTSTQPVISIVQYGAVGDGATNDTAAIQNALNYAAAHGDAVYIPAGTYDYSTTITDNGVTIYGAGTASVLKATNGANEFLILTGSGAAVSSLEMLGAGSTRLSTWQSGMIWANGASNYTIDNVLINGSSSVGIASVGGTGGNIYANTVENTLADSITSVDGSNNITITQNHVLNSGDDGISIVSYGGEPIVNGITETGNLVEGNNWGRGMSVVGGENVTMTGNTIKGGSSPYAGIYLAAESSYNTLSVSNVTATGNTLVNCGGSGCQGAVTIYSSVAGESLSGLVVNGNTIVTPGMVPVQITGGDPVQLQLENNTAYGSGSTFLDNGNGAASVTQSGNQDLAASAYVAGALPAAGVGSTSAAGGAAPATPAVPNDFNGSGTSDVLLDDPTTGALGDFLMQNGQPTWQAIGWADPSFQVAGTGNLNGGATADILFSNPTTGAVGEFSMHNNQPTWQGLGSVDPAWQVAGVGDFTGNGTDDVLFSNPTSGALGDFLMNNGQPAWHGIGTVGSGWQAAGVGDFTGNGTDDILFSNPTTGAVGEFLMNNNQPTWQGVGAVDPAWQVAGVGDFTGNGTDDVLFQNAATGALGDFLMSNGKPTWQEIGSVDPGWKVAGTGDYHGNGTDDILFSNATTGAVGMFAMNNNTPTWQGIGCAATCFHPA